MRAGVVARMTTREIELEKALRAQKDRSDLLAAWLARYVVDYSIDHLKDCPEDDTCECPHVRYINAILQGSQTVDKKDDPSYLRGQLALAARDRDEAVHARRLSDQRRFLLESTIRRHLDDDTIIEDEVDLVVRVGRQVAAQKAELSRLNDEVGRLQNELNHTEKSLRDMNDNTRGLLDSLRARLSRKSAP